MFGLRYFANRFFGGRYWGHVGAEPEASISNEFFKGRMRDAFYARGTMTDTAYGKGRIRDAEYLKGGLE